MAAMQTFNDSAEIITSMNFTVPPRITAFAEEPRAVFILRLVVGCVIAITGFVCNAIVIVHITRRCRRLSLVEFYIRNLAVADLGILCGSYPIAVIREQFHGAWPLGEVMCYYGYPLTEVFYAVSVWSITAIAAERYQLVRKNFQKVSHKRSSSKTRWRNTFIIWLGSFSLTSLPLFFIMDYKNTSGEGGTCKFSWPSGMHHVYVVSLTILQYILPMGIISFTYLHIAKEIKTSSKFHRRTIRTSDIKKSWGIQKFDSHEERRLKENKRARKLLTPLVLVFAVTMFPLNTLRLVVLLWQAATEWTYFLIVYNLSVFGIVVNSAADPIIYSIVSKEFDFKVCWHWLRLCSQRMRMRKSWNNKEEETSGLATTPETPEKGDFLNNSF
ncbi:neuropeptide Y receptor type 6 [Nematostella vectensis]|uniref:neuropeptide Y receptor type 6 n=1 Tax=Nematostella vectensis TaxID=45351 RepID=UPI0020770346|nr:neuropeptide Y receptor type 6 [Nematostella vectensis]